MLNSKKKEIIRKITVFKCAFYEDKKGKPIYVDNSELIIPSFPQIREMVFDKILKSGFSEIKLVSPGEANCIIRVYTKQHYEYERDIVFNLYGADCFTKKSGKWVSEGGQGEFDINYSKCVIRNWLYQDEYVDINCDFFDCYCMIK